MMSFISKTFGGLNKSYYLRHLFFGFILYALMCGLLLQASKGVIDSKLITAVLMLTVLPDSAVKPRPLGRGYKAQTA
ncbi:hypothetical protein [Gallibacterium sp. AGMB14963]|uniref:hypothetical protein n=1 Tax=Gallibacterium faecale TaxID=3019086 RepID=UPI0022F177B6|nr:hypothetical protein [Gallibacterium sp. AGMB14963]MDA3979838.1 hypothetical protein [Gallibacterium sp. AGMB14963]